MGRFEGQVALITGGARGMGRSHALALAREGADIALVDMCHDLGTVGYPLATAADLEETAALVRKEGRRAWTFEADVRDFEALQAAVDAVADPDTEDGPGRLDIVIANAGVSAGDSIQVAGAEQWRDVIEINLTGTFHTFRAAAPHLIRARRGRMVGISSMMGRAPTGAMGAYTASKWGVIGLVKSSAQDLAHFGITVNAVAPGNVDTPMVRNDFLTRKVRPDLENPTFDDAKAFIGMLHVQPDPLLQPEEISAAILFLCSEDARHITGTVIDVSAGATARASA
ncbi:MAG TPA: mycofactocin-coupled SDR family oxidoreductase [Acidimicrobiales bacterium]|nr:mycofactocin-coupled SDR family oxidoreductase [Acidimicrobiales bacterium]